LQPLAERLWRRTAAPATPGLAYLPRPAAPNTDLRFTPYDGAAGPGIAVPVLELAPRWFGAWARLVSGSSGPQPTAVATFPSRPSGTAPLHRERELPIGERVRRFLSTASPDAAELAAHVAVSVPSLPVMRLIQHRILGGSGPGQLAEVLLSGLLRPAGGVRYEFVPGAREALLDTLPRPEAQHTRRVLEAVSAEIERRVGTSADRFRALLPTEGGPVTLTADTDHFALLTPQTRTHLTPTPPPLAAPDLLDLLGTPVGELLDEEWQRGPHPTALGVADGGAPLWLTPFGDPDRPHGEIVGPRATRRELIRTLLFSLALSHSPDIVTFVYYGVAVGLDDLPHAAPDALRMRAGSLVLARLPALLETERRRREAILRSAKTPTWFDYQSALAGGRRLEPLPALIIILDGSVLGSQEAPEHLSEAIVQLCEKGPALGMEFVFCSPEDRRWPTRLTDSVWWRITASSGQDGGTASLHIIGEGVHDFLPAHVSNTAGEHIVEEMSRAMAPVPEVSERDVLSLNGGGPNDTFKERWALPDFTPRNPVIGHDAAGNVAGLHPLDLSSGIPHGLVVGETEARQRVLRAITLAVAASYSPSDLGLVFAGLGEHPLGEPIDLPHVIVSDHELLGRRDVLDRVIMQLRQVDGGRGNARTWPRLLVVADLSLTFPSGRRDFGETLISLAPGGRARNVQLLLASTTVEDTTIWNRFLPLLGWRIVASRLPPAELRRVLGRPTLPFPDDRTAYLLAEGGTPRPFTIADEPSQAAIDDFVERARNQLEQTTSEPHRPTPGQQGEDESVMDMLHGEGPEGPHHLVFKGSDWPQMARAAHRYGQMLHGQGVLSSGEVREVDPRGLVDLHIDQWDSTWPAFFPEGRGDVWLFRLNAIQAQSSIFQSKFYASLAAMMDAYGDNPAVVVCGNADDVYALRRTNPSLADRFRTIVDFDEARALAPEVRILLGTGEAGEPVHLDFATDRHLLISGPAGTGKTALIRTLIRQVAESGSAPDAANRRLYFLDEQRPPAMSHPEFAARFGVRYSDDGDEIASLVDEAAAYARRGRECHVFAANHTVPRDVFGPLLGQLASSPSGLHLVVSHRDRRGEAHNRVVARLRELNAALLLTGNGIGRTARTWGVPAALHGSIQQGHGVLARGDDHRRIRLIGP
ncbi:MAG: hypothetical protein ACRDNL_13425, partial [Spirillospora sp.]